jgi:hypothetical protein
MHGFPCVGARGLPPLSLITEFETCFSIIGISAVWRIVAGRSNNNHSMISRLSGHIVHYNRRVSDAALMMPVSQTPTYSAPGAPNSIVWVNHVAYKRHDFFVVCKNLAKTLRSHVGSSCSFPLGVKTTGRA